MSPMATDTKLAQMWRRGTWPQQQTDGSYRCASGSVPGRIWTQRRLGDRWVCDCPAMGKCKHLTAVQASKWDDFCRAVGMDIQPQGRW